VTTDLSALAVELDAVEAEMEGVSHTSTRYLSAEQAAAVDRAYNDPRNRATGLHQQIADVHDAHHDTNPCEGCW
jgi:hypothetical protein